MAQGRQQNNGSRQRCAQSAAAKAPAEPPKAVCAQLEELKKVMDVYELSDEEYEAFRDIAATSWDAAKEAMGDEYFDLLMSEVEKAEAALKN